MKDVPKLISFSAEEFVNNLLKEGSEVPCDETSESFRKTEVLPYYDEKLYKRGQAFFYENLYSLLFSKFMGLISVIALPDSLKILMMTGMTSSPVKAYRRYLATVLHVITWYSYDLSPESRVLASIADVKRKHNTASKQSIKTKKLKYRISQKDMALTQFGFMGFGLVRSKMVGVHNPSEEDLKGFIHVWRVLGYLLGIEDRFNICRESVQETKEICNILIEKVFKPILWKPEEDFVKMINYFVDGFSAVDPLLDYETSMTFLQMLLENTDDFNNLKNPKYKNVSLMVKLKLYLASVESYLLKFKIGRLFFRYVTLLRFWVISVFPLPAYIKFGFKNGYVDCDKIYPVKIKHN